MSSEKKRGPIHVSNFSICSLAEITNSAMLVNYLKELDSKHLKYH